VTPPAATVETIRPPQATGRGDAMAEPGSRLRRPLPVAPQPMTRLRRLAAALLILSSLTHVAQLAVYGRNTHVIAAAAFGIVYGVVGLLLVRRSRAGLWLAIILPCVGGGLGRFVTFRMDMASLPQNGPSRACRLFVSKT
jgi:hypothetical protein